MHPSNHEQCCPKDYVVHLISVVGHVNWFTTIIKNVQKQHQVQKCVEHVFKNYKVQSIFRCVHHVQVKGVY